MRKRIILCAFLAMPLILFNLLFFVIGGTAHPKSVWLSYAWMQFAFLLLIVSPMLARKTENAPVYKITLALISGVYFLVEFVIGLIVIILRPDGITGPLVAQIIPFSLFMMVFLCDLLFIEFAADADQRHAAKEKAEKENKK